MINWLHFQTRDLSSLPFSVSNKNEMCFKVSEKLTLTKAVLQCCIGIRIKTYQILSS